MQRNVVLFVIKVCHQESSGEDKKMSDGLVRLIIHKSYGCTTMKIDGHEDLDHCYPVCTISANIDPSPTVGTFPSSSNALSSAALLSTPPLTVSYHCSLSIFSLDRSNSSRVCPQRPCPLHRQRHGKVYLLDLLDLTAVFDTVDHQLLLSLANRFSVDSTALSWFESYLTNRTQTFTHKGGQTSSSPAD